MTLSAEAFRNELYASTAIGSLADLTFSGVVSHRANCTSSEKKGENDTAGSDAALAALQNSMASYHQEKQAKQSTIVNSVLPTKGRLGNNNKNNRSLHAATPSASPSLRGGPTSNPNPSMHPGSNSEAAVRQQALRKPLIHLLALRPASTETIVSQTHIPKEDLESILQKIARQEAGKWNLSDRAYKDLDVWGFGYTSQEDRQTAVDNAVRAYDRQRIGKEEKMWQQLLPEEDRGKGIVLSRLNGVGAAQANRGLTPNHARSPLPDVDKGDENKPASSANTPKLGAATPRPGGGKGDVMKRLLSKDPKKARALEEAREKKRKDREAREATASDRESARPAKRPTTKKENPKVKSAEIVHSSDDESGEEGEVREEITRVDSKVSPEKPKPKPVGKPKSGSPNTNTDQAAKAKDSDAKPATKSKAPANPAKSIASLAGKSSNSAGVGRNTPSPANGLAAPTSQHKSQRSPQKPGTKPNVPSPLGAARPRLASDVSDRSAIGVQRTKQGASTPQGLGLGITSGPRRRHDTVTSNDSGSSSGSDKKRAEEKPARKTQKPATNGTGTPKPAANGVAQKSQNGAKRKAEDTSSQDIGDRPEAKHRKTESMSSQSQNSHGSTTATAQSTARTSPDLGEGSGSDSATSVIDSITYTQGVNLAEKFRDVYYPAYTKMYDAQAAKEAKGETISKDERDRLWAMHRRLEQMKREIQIAAQREQREE